MKLKHLLTVAVMAAIGGGNAWAQDLVAGTYYLRNVEAGKYVAWGAAWGTRSVLTEHGADIKVTLSNGNYTLITGAVGANNALRPSDGYADQSGTWTITPVGDGTYTIMGSAGYYRYDGTALPAVNGSSSDSGIYWEFLSKEDLTAKMADATIDAPVDATHFITAPDFLGKDSRITNGAWKGFSNTAFAANSQPKYNGPVGSGNTLINNTNCEAYNMQSVDINQTLTGLPKGTYRLAVMGFYRAGSAVNAATAHSNGTEELFSYIYAGSEVTPLQSICTAAGKLSGVGTDTSLGKVPNSNEDAAKYFEAGFYQDNYVYFYSDGTDIAIGMKKNFKVDADWTIIDNFDLKYYGDVSVADVQLAEYVKAYNEAKETVAAINQDYLSEADKTALNTLITENTVDLSSATQEQLETAAANLNAAAPIYSYKAKVGELAAQGDNTDFTSLLVNPSFETGNTNGWTNNSANGMWTVMTRANADDPKVGNYWLEKYGNAGKIDIKQTVTNLPKGLYRVGVLALDQASKVKLVGNDTEKTIEGGVKATYTVNIYLDEDNSDITLGLYSETHEANKWVGFDDFHLTFVSSDFPALTAVEGKMEYAVAQAQTAALAAFNADKNFETYQAAADAIAAAQASVDKYAAAKIALDNQQALIDATNVYDELGLSGYVANYNNLKEKYDNNSLGDWTVVNPNEATGWHASTDYNFLLTPWTFGGEACNNFDKDLHINTWSTEGDRDGSNFQVPFFEYWVADDLKLADNTISTEVTGLENGLYSATAWVRVRTTNGLDALLANGVNLIAGDGTYAGTEGNGTVDATNGTRITDTNFSMSEVTAYGLVKDGKLQITLDVKDANISWLAFKNVMYAKVRDLTPEEQTVYATAEDIEKLNEAIEAAEEKTVGFQAGNYSPYTNAEAIKALADAKAIDTENPVDVEKINAAIAAIADANWTVNTEEVNAINNGDFEGTYAAVAGAGVSSDRDIFLPAGWSFRKNGIDKNDIVVLNTSDKAGNNVTTISELENGGDNTIMYRGKWGSTTNLDFYQKITLPAGTYYLECDAWKSGLGGDGKIYVGANNEASLDGNDTSWRKLSLVFTLEEEKTVEVGFNIKHNSDNSEKFIGFDNFVLKKAETARLKITDAQWGTFCAPFNVDVPEGVTAYTVEIEDEKLVYTEAVSIEADEAYVVYSEGVFDKTFFGKNIASGNEVKTGCLVGTYNLIDAPQGSYILQKNDDKVGFYYVADEGLKVGANRCYLKDPNSYAKKNVFYLSNPEATAIEGLNAMMTGNVEGIYNAAGVLQNGMQKGLNIVKMANGKTAKVMVK